MLPLGGFLPKEDCILAAGLKSLPWAWSKNSILTLSRTMSSKADPTWDLIAFFCWLENDSPSRKFSMERRYLNPSCFGIGVPEKKIKNCDYIFKDRAEKIGTAYLIVINADSF